MSANFHVLGSTFHPDPQLTEWYPHFENGSSPYISQWCDTNAIEGREKGGPKESTSRKTTDSIKSKIFSPLVCEGINNKLNHTLTYNRKGYSKRLCIYSWEGTVLKEEQILRYTIQTLQSFMQINLKSQTNCIILRRNIQLIEMEGLSAHISMEALKKATKDQLYYGVDPDYLSWKVSREEGTGEILLCLQNGGGLYC